jgi:hypothetical protein
VFRVASMASAPASSMSTASGSVTAADDVGAALGTGFSVLVALAVVPGDAAVDEIGAATGVEQP